MLGLALASNRGRPRHAGSSTSYDINCSGSVENQKARYGIIRELCIHSSGQTPETPMKVGSIHTYVRACQMSDVSHPVTWRQSESRQRNSPESVWGADPHCRPRRGWVSSRFHHYHCATPGDRKTAVVPGNPVMAILG
jgi:hypothetical protein